jgi:hypothetical protein
MQTFSLTAGAAAPCLPHADPHRAVEIAESRAYLSGMSAYRFDRFAVLEAFYLFMVNYHNGQGSPEYALSGTFHRVAMRYGYRVRHSISQVSLRKAEKNLSPNGFLLYRWLVKTHGVYIRDRR